MTKYGSAPEREATPHVKRTSRTNTILNALTRGAQTVLTDRSLDPQSRAIIRSALETNDPWLAKLVRRAATGESSETQIPETNHDYSVGEKIDMLAEIICRGAEDSPAALFVLMATVETSADPKALANAVKHYSFARCAELNLFDMVDAQIETIEGALLAGNMFT